MDSSDLKISSVFFFQQTSIVGIESDIFIPHIQNHKFCSWERNSHKDHWHSTYCKLGNVEQPCKVALETHNEMFTFGACDHH